MCFLEPVGEDEVIKLNMALAERNDFTVADVDALPEDVRAEIIDGRIFLMASPKVIHQTILYKLWEKIDLFITSKDGSCQTYGAPLDIYLNCDDKTRVQPDIFVVCDQTKIHEDACYGAPDLVIEIISKFTKSRDYGIKMLKYHTAGVHEYWIIDPNQKNVTVFWFDDETQNCQYSFDEDISFRLYPELTVCINDLI